jgi:predicted transcriptional regulator
MLDIVTILREYQNNASSPEGTRDAAWDDMRQALQDLSRYLSKDMQERGQSSSVLAALIVACYVRRHDIAFEILPDLVIQLRRALSDQPTFVTVKDRNEKSTGDLRPAVPIEASVAPDFIICLEDGRSCKSLKRYLRDHHAMTPDVYRLRWGLPDNYPMVAPNFSRRRAEIARQNRLGRYARS